MKWLILILLPLFLVAKEPFFTFFEPPKDWVLSDPSKLEEGVKVAFVASKKRMFTPSLSLTLEKIGTASIETYTKALEKIYQSDRFQKLGTFHTNIGLAHLFQIDLKSTWGEVRVLQAITLHKGYAIIQTGSCLKKEFLTLHQTYLDTFKSLDAKPSLLETCNDPALKKLLDSTTKSWNQFCKTAHGEKQTLFLSNFFQTNHWKPFADYIEKKLDYKGACWQFLAIKHIQETLLTENEI